MKNSETIELKHLGDQKKFQIAKGKTAPWYTLQSKNPKKKEATYTSDNSGKTYTRNWNLQVRV